MQLVRRSVPLDGATVIITGGARGIGAKTAAAVKAALAAQEPAEAINTATGEVHPT